MNNSLIQPESNPQLEKVQEKTQEREATVVRIIEAVQRIKQSEDWSTLKTEVFDSLTKHLKSELFAEAKKESPDTNKLNRLAGELKWSERFSDLEKYENVLRVELQGIRLRLHGKTD